jgi:hypothetical protein
MRNRILVIVGGLLIAGALVVAAVAAISAQAQPTPVTDGTGADHEQSAQPGMMSSGGMGAQSMPGSQGMSGQQASPLKTLDAAKTAFEGYIDRTGNADLAVDQVMQFQWNYYATVKEKSTSSGAFELLANPQTGAVFLEMGPTMMWNTKYGAMMAAHAGGMMGMGGGMGMDASSGSGDMMSGTWGPTAPAAQPTVTPDQAQQFAQAWLDDRSQRSSAAAPSPFPGYYTLHVTKDGQITGLLSVNAHTAQVWYHTWLGAMVAST